MNRRLRLPVRARLTLLNTSLFAAGGAIVIAVSYVLVAQLGTTGQVGSLRGATLATFVAQCHSEPVSSRPVSPRSNTARLAKCNRVLQELGAKHQRALTLSHLLEYSLLTMAVVIALAAALGWILSGRALRPVRRVTEAARAASEHNLSARVALQGPKDELTELADTFDDLLSRLQTAFTSQSRFIANASHELRTPLAVMRAAVDVVADDPNTTAADLQGLAADIRDAVEHAEQLIAALLILARNERGLTVYEQIDLATVAEDILDTADLSDRRVHVSLNSAVVSGDPVLTELLTANLVDNAVRYNTSGGEIWITTDTADAGSQLTVSNTGPAVDTADTDRIFEPFQRLNDRVSHDGFGLGLAIVASITSIHMGAVTAQPRDGGGLTITVTIPPPDSHG